MVDPVVRSVYSSVAPGAVFINRAMNGLRYPLFWGFRQEGGVPMRSLVYAID